jgi:hypothetical protein
MNCASFSTNKNCEECEPTSRTKKVWKCGFVLFFFNLHLNINHAFNREAFGEGSDPVLQEASMDLSGLWTLPDLGKIGPLALGRSRTVPLAPFAPG